MGAIIQRLLGWANIGVYAVLIYEMLRLLLAPEFRDVDRIITLSVMMGFEFIMVHSGIFMAVFPRKISILFFLPFYAAFAFVFNAMTPGNEILYLYFAVVFLRMRFAFSNPTPDQKAANIIMSVAAGALYFVLIFIFAMSSELLPKFGLTDKFLSDSGYLNDVSVGGIFTDMPHVPLTMGVVYFALLTLFEIKFLGLLKPIKNTKD